MKIVVFAAMWVKGLNLKSNNLLMTVDREPLNTDGFRFAMNQIDDGFVFENCGLSFLGATLGYDFIPVGGVKDKGIDGLDYVYNQKGYEKVIYQLSTELNSANKLETSIQKLVDNKIPFDSITYVTNRIVLNKDTLIDTLFDKFKKHIKIFDQNWIVGYANHSEGTVNAYYTFIDSICMSLVNLASHM